MWRNKLIAFLLLLSGLFSMPANAACAGGTCFAIATGNWGTAGTWALTSGGVSCVCTPATGDAIVMDATSGNITLTMEAAYSILSLDATGFTGTLTQNAFTMTVSGNTFKLVAGMTYTPSASTRLVSFTSSSGTTLITTASKVLGAVSFGVGPVTTGTYQIQDALNYRSDGALTLTGGTLDANNFNITGGTFSSANSNVRAILMGSGTWLMNAIGGTLWDCSTCTNMTVTPSSSTISTNATVSSSRTISLGTKTYNNLSVNSTSAVSTIVDFGSGASPTFNGTVSIANARQIRFPGGQTWTVTGAFTLDGTSSSQNMLYTNNSSAWTLSVGAANTWSWNALQFVTKSGAGSITCNNCFDGGSNNTSGTFVITTPTSGGGKIIGGWLLGRDLINVNDNVPLFLNVAA